MQAALTVCLAVLLAAQSLQAQTVLDWAGLTGQLALQRGDVSFLASLTAMLCCCICYALKVCVQLASFCNMLVMQCSSPWATTVT